MGGKTDVRDVGEGRERNLSPSSKGKKIHCCFRIYELSYLYETICTEVSFLKYIKLLSEYHAFLKVEASPTYPYLAIKWQIKI